MAGQKVYFPGLYGLRFVAAIAILIVHVELTKKFMGHGEGLWFDPDNAERVASTPFQAVMDGTLRWEAAFIMSFGPQALIFFFVLSGFLVTYLLLEEKRVTGSISLKKFFVRRFLRLWPLYYLFVILGFFVFPFVDWLHMPKQWIEIKDHYWVVLGLFLLLLPNVSLALYGKAFPNIGQMWSIGIEEQFYIFWPVILKIFKNVLWGMIGFTALIFVIKVAVYLLPGTDETTMVIKRFFAMFKVECIGIGGIGAYFMFHNTQPLMNWIYSKSVQWIAIISIPVIAMFLPAKLLNVSHLIYSIPSLIISMNVGANPKSVLKLNHNWLDYLGKISYGIYMFHFVCITFTIHLLSFVFDLPQRLTWWQNTLVYVISIGLTIAIAALSYEYFEKKFLTRKKKYVTVDSGKL